MKSAPSGLISLLATATQLIQADLYTITLLNGTVLRYTNFDVNVTIGGNTFLANDARWTRGTSRVVTGLEVDTLEADVAGDATHLVNGVPIVQAIAAKTFDGADFKLEIAFSGGFGQAWQGPITWFWGTVASAETTRSSAKLTVNSLLDRLTIQLPKKLIQAGCPYTLYDANCALAKASFGVTGSVGVASNAYVINNALTQPTGYFDIGTITFTSGANAGMTRVVRSYVTGQITLNIPLPVAPLVGDTFTVYPGCDKTQATCTNKFSNLVNFGGAPYVPVPETAF